jgi:hypothetical protein
MVLDGHLTVQVGSTRVATLLAGEVIGEVRFRGLPPVFIAPRRSSRPELNPWKSVRHLNSLRWDFKNVDFGGLGNGITSVYGGKV